MNLSVYVQTAELPVTWYVNMQYTIRVYVDDLALISVPNATIRLAIQNLTATDDTGPIAAGATAYIDFDLTLDTAGPATLALKVVLPAGYTDFDKSNNTVNIAVEVQPQP